MIRHPCPPHHRWAALLADDLPPAEQADLNGHLELCPACQRALEDCAAHRDAWVAARTLGTLTQPRSPILSDVIDQLKLDPDSDHDSSDGAALPLDFLDPPDRPGPLGRIHQYEVLEEVGRGGMGVVLKALDPGLHRVVAIKVLAPQLAVSGTARKRFTREARAAAAVGHENVVTIHAVEEFKGLPYLVMQYIAGPSVQQRLADGGPLPVAEILRIGFQTAAGLAAAHAQGLIHRDVKPANILLENGVERVKLTDFSLARAIDDASVTQTGVVTGTPPYMAPEQARGEPLDHRADLFSLGSVMYALCTGRAPFRGQSLDVLRRVSEETPVPILTLNPEIPAWLEGIVMKLMAKNPEERFQSAGEVSALLERCLAHVQQPTIVPLPAGLSNTESRARSKRQSDRLLRARLIIGLAAASVAALLAITILRLRTNNGTLEITLDDSNATVTVDGTDIVVSGLTGVKEFRLKAGDYTVHQTKDGKPEKAEVVSIKQGEKTPLRVTFEGDDGSRLRLSETDLPAKPQAALAFPTPDTRPGSQTSPVTSDVNAKRMQVLRQLAADLERTRAQQRAAEARVAAVDGADAKKEELLKAREELADAGVQVEKIENVIRGLQVNLAANRRRRAFSGDTAAIESYEEQLAIIASLHLPYKSVNRLVVPTRVFPTAADKITSAVFSRGGENLFIADLSGTIYSYNFVDGKQRFTLAPSKDGENRFLAVSPDDSYLVAVGAGGTIQFIDRGKVRQSLAGKCNPYYAVAFTADGKTLAAGGAAPDGVTGLLELWDIESGKVRTVEFPSPVRSLAIPPGHPEWLAVGTDGDGVRMVDVPSAKVKYTMRQSNPVRAIAFAPDGQWIAASAGDNQVHFGTTSNGWRTVVHKGIDLLTGHTGRVTSINVSPDGKLMVTASLDGTAKIWEVRRRKCLETFVPGTYKSGMSVALFTPDGQSIITAGDDGQIRVWDVTSTIGKTATTTTDDSDLHKELGVKKAMAAERSRRLAAEATPANKVGDGMRATHPQGTFQTAAGGPILSAAFALDGHSLFVAGEKRPVQRFDLQNGAAAGATTGQWGDAPLVAVAPDGVTIATANGHSVSIYGPMGKRWNEGFAQVASIYALAFGPGGKTLAIGGRTDQGKGFVQFWSPDTGFWGPGTGPGRRIDFPVAVLSLAFDFGNQSRLAVGLNTDNIRMVDTKKAEVIYTLPQSGPIDLVAFSPNAKWLAAAEGANQVRLWDWQTSRMAAVLTGHTDRVTSVRFSGNNQWVATASLDGTARLWDVPTGRIVATFAPNAGKLYVAEFSPDGKSLITAGENRAIRVWDLTTATAKQPPGDTSSGTPAVPHVQPDSFPNHQESDVVMTQILVHHVAPEELAVGVKKRLGPVGEVSVDVRTKSLLVRDTVGNLRVILKDVAEMDKPSAQNKK